MQQKPVEAGCRKSVKVQGRFDLNPGEVFLDQAACRMGIALSSDWDMMTDIACN